MLRCCFAFLLWLSAAPAMAQPMLISVSDLALALKDQDVVVLHIADRVQAFEEGHIPGARFVRYGDFAVEGEDNIGSELPPADVIERVFEAAGVSDNSRVVVYSASTVLAARAFFTLDVYGHARVALLDGGLRAWREAGRPIEAGAVAVSRPGEFSARMNRQRVADAAYVQTIQKRAAQGSAALVDVRPDDEFLGINTMGGAHAPGHIEGAKQLTWNSLVDAAGRFLPPAQLRARLESAGAGKGTPVVAYCMVGMRASVVYFVSRYLGHEVKLYDGSIVDWSRRKLPMTKAAQ